MTDPIRVLIVDDEPSICRALSIALSRSGCRVSIATNGDEAVNWLRREPLDVLILDLRIPDLRGDAVYQLAIALQPRLRGATLFVTGDVTERAESLVQACGAACFIRKPFELADVVNAVHALVPGTEGKRA
ncbi:MAG TPA: response regulator [Gemmatimonadaceae bacterium]|nr:response regulator [Gemmatimonadaceae bacterium]